MVNVALFQADGFAVVLADSTVTFPDLAPRLLPYFVRLS
jgi:hypothetical protein